MIPRPHVFTHGAVVNKAVAEVSIFSFKRCFSLTTALGRGMVCLSHHPLYPWLQGINKYYNQQCGFHKCYVNCFKAKPNRVQVGQWL